MTYVLSVATNRNLDLAATLPAELANLVRICMRGPGYSVSQELAAVWISEGIDSVVFPSATGVGGNVAVSLANTCAGSVVVCNRAEVSAAIRRPRAGKRRSVSDSSQTCSSLGQALFAASFRTDPLCEYLAGVYSKARKDTGKQLYL
jgi:hypothetical protein